MVFSNGADGLSAQIFAGVSTSDEVFSVNFILLPTQKLDYMELNLQISEHV